MIHKRQQVRNECPHMFDFIPLSALALGIFIASLTLVQQALV